MESQSDKETIIEGPIWKMSTKFILLGLLVAIVVIAIVCWNIAGRIALNNVKEFKYNNEYVYDSDADYGLSVGKSAKGEQHRIDIENTDEAEEFFKMIENKFRYKSMELALFNSGSPYVFYTQDYDHYVATYRLTLDEGNGKRNAVWYQISITKQEGASYIKYSLGNSTITLFVEFDEALLNYLETLFD